MYGASEFHKLHGQFDSAFRNMLYILYTTGEGENWRVVSGINDDETRNIYERGYYIEPRGLSGPIITEFFTKRLVADYYDSLYRTLDDVIE